MATQFPEMYAQMKQNAPRIINNPIISREVIAKLRRKSSFIQLGCFLILTTYFLLPIWSEAINLYSYNPSGGRTTFYTLTNLQFFLTFLFVPMLTATAVNTEKERATWDILRTSPINIASILFGKMLGATLYFWLCLVSLTPIIMICMPLGGLSISDILIGFCSLTSWIILIASISVYSSSISMKTTEAITQSYLRIFFFFILLPAILMIIDSQITSPQNIYICFLFSPIYMQSFINSIGQMPQIMNYAWFPFNNIHAFYCLHYLVVFIVSAIFLVLSCYFASRPDKIRKRRKWFSRKKRSRPTFTHSPMGKQFGALSVYQKEIREWFVLNRWRAFISLAGFTFISGIASIFAFISPFPTRHEFMIGLFWLLLPWLILPYASNTIRSEVDRDTLDVLSTTTMPPWRIVVGKWLAAVLIAVSHFIAYAILWYPVAAVRFGFGQFIISKWPVFLLFAPVSVLVSSALIISIALCCSTQFKTTVSTYLSSFSLGILIITGAWIFFINLQTDNYFAMLASPMILFVQYTEVNLNDWMNLLMLQLSWMILITVGCLYFASTRMETLIHKSSK